MIDHKKTQREIVPDASQRALACVSHHSRATGARGDDESRTSGCANFRLADSRTPVLGIHFAFSSHHGLSKESERGKISRLLRQTDRQSERARVACRQRESGARE